MRLLPSKLFLLFTVLIILFIGLINAELRTLDIQKQVSAHQGQITLTNVSDVSHPIIPLKGQWVFYPNQLFTPKQLTSNTSLLNEKNLITVPKVWGQGYGTYVLNVVLTDKEKQELNAIYFPSISSAFRVWVNGAIIHSSGVVGTSRASTVAEDRPGIALVPNTNSNQLKVVIQVSNFIQQKGGIGEVPYLGNLQSLIRLEDSNLALQLFIIGSLFTMALYCSSLYFSYRRDKFPLYFALFCGDVIVQALFLHNSTLTTLLPNISWVLETKIQYISISIGLILLLLSTKALYPKDSLRKIEFLFFTIGIAFTCICLVTPTWIFTYALSTISVTVIAAIGYIVMVFIRGMRHRRPYALINILSLLFLIASVINDILYYLNFIRSEELIPIGLFIYVLIQTVLYSVKHTRAEVALMRKTSELVSLNETLEARIQERTRELSRTMEDLYQSNTLWNQLAMRDTLTSLPNRRFFETALNDLLQSSSSTGTALTLLLIDIDYFKQFNDSYGHMRGDTCLREIALTLETHLRKYDNAFVARLGGEEFVAVIPNVDEETATEITVLLLQCVRNLNVPHIGSAISPCVTISIGGVRAHLNPNITAGLLVAQADENLYQAKDGGRNQYVLSTLTSDETLHGLSTPKLDSHEGAI